MSSQYGTFFLTWVTSFYFLVYGFTNVFFFFFFFQNTKKKFDRFSIFILSSDVTILASLILKQGVQGLQASAFCISTINDDFAKQT